MTADFDSDLDDDQAALLDEIESDEPSAQATASLDRTMGEFLYTASLLAALADWLREEGDDTGAALALGFSQEMAQHEARTL